MAGIYIHIPFCQQVCHYCDFFKRASLKAKDQLITAIVKELELQKGYLEGQIVETVYFGGGTPSILRVNELVLLLDTVFKNYPVAKNVEITLEANPDDLTADYLSELALSPINRLSIGIQSFNDDLLTYMNRRHTGRQAHDAVLLAKEQGFNNITIDLIYGIPGMSQPAWASSLQTAFSLGIQHISAYHLTIEPNTVFHYWHKKKQLSEIPEGESVEQFRMLIDAARQQGMEHYEISNFAMPNYYSRHNSAYWQQKAYLGVGPSAHSYNGSQRQWNIANLHKYIGALEQGVLLADKETVTDQNRFNELVMVGLRTIWGVQLSYLQTLPEHLLRYFEQKAAPYLATGQMQLAKGAYSLQEEALFVSDGIIEDFFYVDN